MRSFTVSELFELWFRKNQQRFRYTPQVEQVTPNYLVVTLKGVDPALEFRFFLSGMLITYTMHTHRYGNRVFPLDLTVPFRFHSTEYSRIVENEKSVNFHQFMLQKIQSMFGNDEVVFSNLSHDNLHKKGIAADFNRFNSEYVKHVLNQFEVWIRENISPKYKIVASGMANRGDFRKIRIQKGNGFQNNNKQFVIGPVLDRQSNQAA